MQKLVYIFYVEAALNIMSGVAAFFAPQSFMSQFYAASVPPAVNELARWYGVLLFVIAYLLVRTLRVRGTPLKLVLETLLIGDIIQIVAVLITVRALGAWPFIASTTLIVSIGYMLARILCLYRPTLTGIEEVDTRPITHVNEHSPIV